jgi:hypothetical protein
MDNPDSQIEIKLCIPEELRQQAAIVCYEGFRSQVEWLFGSQEKACVPNGERFDRGFTYLPRFDNE